MRRASEISFISGEALRVRAENSLGPTNSHENFAELGRIR